MVQLLLYLLLNPTIVLVPCVNDDAFACFSGGCPALLC